MIYLIVLWVFCFIFVWRLRDIVSKWNTWLLDIPSNSDQEVLDWYRNTHGNGNPAVYDKITAPAALQLARSALFAAVSAERAKPFWAKPTADENVRKLANAYRSTVFILDWYCKFMQTSKPLPYTSTWNLQINVALAALRNSDKGLRLHKGFIHWRYANKEIACGILYFLVALIDRWIELISGGTLIGPLIIEEPGSAFSVSFGLVYFLFSTLVIEVITNPVYDAIKNGSTDRIQSVQHLKGVGRKEAIRTQRLYWVTLGKFFCCNGLGVAFATVFIWTYVEQENGIIQFLGYVCAYTGLLWFQYNKVYAGSSALGPLSLSFVVGVAVGFTLRYVLPHLLWRNVITLSAATWTAGILTFRMAFHSTPEVDDPDTKQSLPHSQNAIGPSSHLNAQRVGALFDKLETLPLSQKLLLRMPNGIASEVFRVLSTSQHSVKAAEIKSAFPYAFSIINYILTGFERGDIVVEGVSLHHMVGQKYDVHAVSRKVDGRLKIYVGMELIQPGEWASNTFNCQTYVLQVVVLMIGLQKPLFTRLAKPDLVFPTATAFWQNCLSRHMKRSPFPIESNDNSKTPPDKSSTRFFKTAMKNSSVIFVST